MLRNKPLPKISRVSWVWLTWFGAGLLMVGAAGLIYMNERGTRLDAAEAQLLTELTYIEHVVAASLRAGSLDQIAEQVKAWGRLNEDTLSLRLLADNGFTIAQFTRPGAPIQRAEHSVVIPFSYRDEATLTLEKSLAPVHAQLDRLGLQLLVAAVIFQLIALVLIRQLYEQRRQTQIARREYERRKRTQAAMERMATQDALTGLPNRRQLEEQLQQRVAESSRYQRRLAVLFIDLDNFKHVNDTHGHAVGDELLKVISSRMQGCLRSYDFLARFGGDEFVVVLNDLHDEGEVERVASKLLESIKPGVELADHQTYVSATIGISLFPDDATEPADLLRHADAAMYTAKSSGRDCYRFFTAALNKAMRQQQIIESGLRNALGSNDLYLVYQPKLDVATGQVTSCEALLRWRRDGIEIPPCEFIPVAERSMLMRQIETFVIEESVSQRARWSREGVGELRININLSGQGLLVGDTLGQIEEALQRFDVQPDQIGIELTEHTLIEATKTTISGLQRLRERGCAISLDDFGTGYSSLGYLKRLPIDVLKIDRAFIRDLPVSAQDASIVSAICAMGHSLGKRTLAEGVETQAQLDCVEQHGCQLIQGYLICRPIPAHAFIDWLRRHRAEPSTTNVANQP
jgi:diguanylate cyclase (GGDEF)-like protein